MAKQLGFYYNTDLCTGCKTCAAACKDKNNTYVGLKYRKVIDYAGGKWSEKDGVPVAEDVFAHSISISCMHCKEPLCMESCPTGAIAKRNDGIVHINEALCTGCEFCNWACPYGAPRMNADKNVACKCDFCMDLIDKGENPACVDACLMRCIEYGDIEVLRKKYGKVDEIAPLPSADYTHPSVVIKPSRWNPKGEDVGRITNAEEELI